jgi:pimeloyl-ACP methyl ester carboxylesterase
VIGLATGSSSGLPQPHLARGRPSVSTSTAVPACSTDCRPGLYPPACSANAGLGGKTPVVVVHGFIQEGRAWEGLVNALNTANTKAFVYDYGALNQQWVKNEKIAGKLADEINCLAGQAQGKKVIVIGYSMGGLAIRCAAKTSCSRKKDAIGSMGLVIDLGTPRQGTSLLLPLRLLPNLCESRNGLRLCSGFGLFDAPTSEAAKGMLPGRLGRLGELPQMDGVPVVAIAGRIQFEYYATLFNVPISSVDIGDGVVGFDSATAGASSVVPVDCGKLVVRDKVIVQLPTCSHLSMADPPFLSKVIDAVAAYRGSGR